MRSGRAEMVYGSTSLVTTGPAPITAPVPTFSSNSRRGRIKVWVQRLGYQIQCGHPRPRVQTRDDNYLCLLPYSARQPVTRSNCSTRRAAFWINKAISVGISLWRMALYTAIFGTVAVFGSAYLIEKSRGIGWLRSATYFISMLPVALPGLVLGLAYIFFFNQPSRNVAGLQLANPFNAIYGTMAILVISNIVHFYTVSFLTATTALKGIDGEFEAVAQSMSVPFYKTFWRVTLPLSLPALLEIGIYYFVNAMVTVSAVIFLYSPSLKLASVAIVNMDDAGDVAAAAAMSMLIVFTALAVRIVYGFQPLKQFSDKWFAALAARVRSARRSQLTSEIRLLKGKWLFPLVSAIILLLISFTTVDAPWLCYLSILAGLALLLLSLVFLTWDQRRMLFSADAYFQPPPPRTAPLRHLPMPCSPSSRPSTNWRWRAASRGGWLVISASMSQAREPMGMEKRAHIQVIRRMESVAVQRTHPYVNLHAYVRNVSVSPDGLVSART